MDLAWLRDFVALAAQKNFSRAATARNVSQPAFSRRIRALENEVGVSLINRQTLPLSLTQAGDVFLAQSLRILNTYAEAIERCQMIDAADAEIIRFATSQSLYVTHYKSHLEPLMDLHRMEVDLNSTSWAADQFVTALMQGYCDVILTYWHPDMAFLAPLEASKCDHITLTTDRLLPVSKTNPQGKPRLSLPAKTKKSVPILAYGSASALNAVVEGILLQHIPPNQVLSVNQHGLAIGIKAMIQEDFGMGWLPESLCREELETGTLSLAGNAELSADLEIRLYKNNENGKSTVRKLWRELEALSEADPVQVAANVTRLPRR